jgi:hypothetical protein
MSYFSNVDLLIKENPELYADYLKQYRHEDKVILRNMIKALQLFGGFMNSDEDSIRLQAAKAAIKSKGR